MARIAQAVFVAFVAVCVTACSPFSRPGNNEPLLFGPEKSKSDGRFLHDSLRDVRSYDQNRCAPAGTTHFIASAQRPRSAATVRAMTMRYSAGDRFNLQVPGSPEFNGDYVINVDGRVILPFAGELRAVGMTNRELTEAIERQFIRARLFAADGFKVAVRPVLYAPINVTVAGAVFLPGRFTISNRDGDKGDKVLTKFGDSPLDRNVAATLRAAGGVRPDADLSNIKLIRDGKALRLDWQGALLGAPVDDVPLIEGDHIEVGETGCFQSALMRPSQISPGGIRIFTSNLTQPATGNAASAISRDATSLPYGTRLLAGLVSANCVGGSRTSNAGRYGVLISRNPKSHRTEVIQRSIEQLVLSADRDEINPYLLPDDAIACYDSAITEIRDVAGFVNTLITPRATWRAN